MSDVYFKASLQNTLNPEVGTFNNVRNKEGIFTLEDGEYYLTNNNMSAGYGLYYPTKDIYSVGFTIEFDINYPVHSDFEWILLFNDNDNSAYYHGFGIWKTALEFRGQTLPDYHIVTSPNTWLHVKCIFEYYDYSNQNNVQIYVNNSKVKTFTISNSYGIKHIDLLGASEPWVSTTKIKNIIIYDNSKKHFLDTTGLTSLWSKIKSLFATKSDLSNYYTKSEIDILLSNKEKNDQ